LITGREADVVEELRDVLRAAGAPIFINRNKLVWLFADGAVSPLTLQRLRFEAQQYMPSLSPGKPIAPPGALIDMFLAVAATYRWFADLDEKERAVRGCG
jgi:hypothetical protein